MYNVRVTAFYRAENLTPFITNSRFEEGSRVNLLFSSLIFFVLQLAGKKIKIIDKKLHKCIFSFFTHGMTVKQKIISHYRSTIDISRHCMISSQPHECLQLLSDLIFTNPHIMVVIGHSDNLPRSEALWTQKLIIINVRQSQSKMWFHTKKQPSLTTSGLPSVLVQDNSLWHQLTVSFHEYHNTI